MQDFPALYYKHAKARGLSQARFGELVGVSAPYVNQVLKHGCAPLPADKAPAWADALGLTGAERDEFILAAELEHCPPGIRARMAAYEREVAELRADLAEVKSLINQPKPKGSR